MRGLARLGLCAALLLSVGVAGAAELGPGPAILVLNEQCGGSVAYFPPALIGLGLGFTETNDSASFLAALTGGTWDIIIVDEYNNALSLGTPTLQAIQDFITGGGIAYMNYWLWDATTAAAFEASLGASYTVPININPWDAGHPLFNSPNAVGTMVPTVDTCNADGARFDPIGGANAIGGYTGAPSGGEAAIIIGNSGRTVLFGGILGLFGNDGLAFAENVVTYLTGPVPVELQEFDVD